MTQNEKTLDELSQNAGEISSKQALIGLDGFVDKTGNEEKLGGLGPALAEGLLATGQKVNYIGALGDPIHPAFKNFAKNTNAVSLCEPGVLEEITFERILEKMGQGIFIDAIFRADLIGFVNWEMIPNMTSILAQIIDKVLPNYGSCSEMVFFFDLANVSQRSIGDLRAVLSTIKRFQNYGDVLLSFDTNNARIIYQSLGHSLDMVTRENAQKIASNLCQALQISLVCIHEKAYATCATSRDHFIIDNRFTTNGISENIFFNVGLLTGFLLRLSPPSCLTLALAFSEYFLANKKNPTLTEITSFISISH